MLDKILTAWLRHLGGVPCFRVYGKSRREPDWRTIDVFATHHRDAKVDTYFDKAHGEPDSCADLLMFELRDRLSRLANET